MKFYRYTPILAIGGLLLAACANAVTLTPSPSGKDESTPLPGDMPTTQEPAQPTLVTDAEPTQNPSSIAGFGQPVNPPTLADAEEGEQDYKIITLLPRDAIEAIFSPQFLTAEEADAEYSPDEPVMGVVFDGEARAYSISYLANHEIVNDTVAGRKIAVTW